jgi:peptidoglycan/xylan/chitin deacetylase (PgdA/CDA1 family)
MDRRRFLLVLAAGLVGAAAGRGTAGLVDPEPTVLGAAREASAAQPATGAGPPDVAAGAPPTGVVDRLPGDGSALALTIDDGTNSEVVAAFVAFAATTGVRLTFFPNGCYSSWQDNAAALRPLVESGQIALGNHTWSHPDLPTLPEREVAEEIRRNRDFLADTFGVRDSPFMRPPFGARNERIDRISADLGHPTIAMWNGTLEDSRVITPADLLDAADRWFAAQAIIVGHANQPPVTTVFDRLHELLDDRGLRTVTLADVWATPAQRLRLAASASARGATL